MHQHYLYIYIYNGCNIQCTFILFILYKTGIYYFLVHVNKHKSKLKYECALNLFFALFHLVYSAQLMFNLSPISNVFYLLQPC